MPLNRDIHKVLVIGSGPIVIGQAAEFDYSGTQACRALREDGIEVVLVNSNPATIMTDSTMADKIYMEPLTTEVLKRICLKEKPDSILSGLGGQTGLNLCAALAESGFLAAHGIRLLGANPETIAKAEDRKLFKETMDSIGQPCIPSDIAEDIKTARQIAADYGIGLYVPGADILLAGRHAYNGSKDPADGATNYVAPLETFAITSYRPVVYSSLITTGSGGAELTEDEESASGDVLAYRKMQYYRMFDAK